MGTFPLVFFLHHASDRQRALWASDADTYGRGTRGGFLLFPSSMIPLVKSLCFIKLSSSSSFDRHTRFLHSGVHSMRPSQSCFAFGGTGTFVLKAQLKRFKFLQWFADKKVQNEVHCRLRLFWRFR